MSNGLPEHVAIIMDGNGRWARERGLPRAVGHRRGAVAVRRIVEHAARLGIANLTLYAFSTDNWGRPADEVAALMRLLERYLRAELSRCITHGVAIEVIGYRNRLARELTEAIAQAETLTAGGSRMKLRLAVDYSSRRALERACHAAGRVPLQHALARELNCRTPIPAVDLLIRAGGEQRLSDFLLLESAYAELYFAATLWPDFQTQHLDDALRAYEGRSRRYGVRPDEPVVAALRQDAPPVPV